jgi:glyoxylase-like metal-dependent hydrolase (beta-lactamase superfamily II)
MKIQYVFETHIHADHISGARELAQKTGAKIALHASADVLFSFTSLIDNQEIQLGNVNIRVLHTPGHTPESICLLVTDKTRGSDPWFVLTGDTLFVGSVGRPDLPGNTKESARSLYQAIQSKIFSLPEFVEIFPAHFSGSVCGKGLSGKPSSTILFEKRSNPTLSLTENEFVEKVSAGIEDKPQEMHKNLNLNRGVE